METRYHKGRRIEYKAKRELELDGYTTIRSSGSHGRWDLVAIKGNEVRCIQVKSIATERGAKRLMTQFLYWSSIPSEEKQTIASEELWIWVKRHWLKSSEVTCL